MKKKKEFETYLQNKFADDYNVKQHINNLNYFNEWLQTNSMSDIIRTTTSVIYMYIQYLQTTSIKNGTINNRLNSLRKYFDCLFKLGCISRNPALSIHIGKRQKKVVENPLDEKALNDFYQRFESFMDNSPKPKNVKVDANNFTKQRYKLIVSLMVFQGLDSGEIDRLCVSDFDAKKGTIYIASKKRSYSRFLNLEAVQILPFYEYIEALPSKQETLFDMKVKVSMNYLLKFIRGIEPKILNAQHIRQSRILVRVSNSKSRDAQYLIGHKFVSSTEYYKQQDTRELVEEINKIHLFK